MVQATSWPAESAEPSPDSDDAKAHSLLSVLVLLRRLPLTGALDRGSLLVLSELALHSPVRPSTIAATLRLDLSTVSRHIRALEDDGLVERSVDPHDARAQSIKVRPQGLAVLEQAFRVRADQIGIATRAWRADEREQLAALLNRLTHDLHPDQLHPDQLHPDQLHPDQPTLKLHARKEHL